MNQLMVSSFFEDIEIAKKALRAIPTEWEGKASVLELKEVDYNWRQMEWWAFYFEYLCRERLKDEFKLPGEKIGRVTFDLHRSVNWDVKAKAIKSDSHDCILNDCDAMDASVGAHGEHGAIIGLCDVEYNDVSRAFQEWHTNLKGGLSAYERKRIARTSVSRYRKTAAVLTEILFLRFDAGSLSSMKQMHQGRNSNGAPRPPKYLLNLEEADCYVVDRIIFD